MALVCSTKLNWQEDKDFKVYYTPSIEDLRMGYECEHKNEIWWVNWKIEDPEFMRSISFRARYWQQPGDTQWSYKLDNIIRTPYLTRGQIEADGWKYKGWSIDQWFEKEGEFERTTWTSYKAVMHYNLEDKWMTIYLVDQGTEQYIFQGVIPSINEFRTITKLLKI